MAKLVYAHGLGSCGEIRGGSSPLTRTNNYDQVSKVMTIQKQRVLYHLVPKKLALVERSWTNGDGSHTISYRARIYIPSVEGYTYKSLSASDIDEAKNEATWLWKSLGNSDNVHPTDVHSNKPNQTVYFIREVGTEFVKIGKSVSPEERLKTLQIGTPHKLELMHIVNSIKYDETWFHRHFSKFHISGEWYRLNDFTINEVMNYA